MVRKCTACNECRKLRRKCIRSSPYEICNRCLRFERECTAPGEMSTESDSDDDNDEMRRLLQEAEELNSIINQLEEQMRTLKRGQQRRITYFLPEDQRGGGTKRREEQDDKTGENGTSNNPWQLTIHNGRFRIETGIRNISDLLRSEPIRYLSPRISTDQSNQDLVIHFNTGKTIRLRVLAIKLLAKCLNPKPDPTALSLPTSFLFNSNIMIDKFVDIYFSCHNAIRPLIHKPTFMKHYKQLASPMDSLLCLCICCSVCATPCTHISQSIHDLRGIGDYFAGLAKSKIMDQFDVPEKRLETLMATTMLGEYMYTVLKVSEGTNLVTLGYQICMDLKPWYDEESQKPGIPSVECMLFSRYYSSMIHFNRLTDVLLNKTEHVKDVYYTEWKYVPDEPTTAIEFVKAQNQYFRLCNHPVMAKIRLYRHHVSADSVHSLKITDIVRVDDIVSDWWNSLPLRYRMCEDWLDTQQLKAKVDVSTDTTTLILIAHSLAYLNDIYCTLLTPNDLGADMNAILSLIQERALKRTLHCSQMAIYVVHRLKKIETLSPCHYILAVDDCMFLSLDVLSILSMSSNVTVKKEAKDMIVECMKRIDDMELMRVHKVDPLHSPLLAGADSSDFNNINPSVYYSYPQPWYAAMYDICKYLETMHTTMKEPSMFSGLPAPI